MAEAETEVRLWRLAATCGHESLNGPEGQVSGL